MGTKKKNNKKVNKKVNKSGNKIWHAIKTGMKVFVLLMLCIVLLLGLLFYNKYGSDLLELQQDAKEVVSTSSVDTFRQAETSLIYDTKGKLLSTLRGAKDVYYIPYEDIPESAVNAMISIEDKKFLQHKGVDFQSIARATLALIRNRGDIKQGASTITQQLSRSIFLSNEVSWERKIKEIFIATSIEKKYKKYQIMEFYLNNIYFANGYYGIQAASKGYFSKDVSKLSLSQIAFLCAIPNNPTIYNPLEHKDNTIKRRDRILNQMHIDGNISEEEYTQAIDETIKLKVKKQIKKNNYVETFVHHSAVKALMKTRGFTFENEFESKEEEEKYNEQYSEYYNECQQSLYNSGYRIYTSIDPNLQKKLQNSVDGVLKDFTEKSEDDVFQLQGAATSIDNETGRVVAIVGGRSQDFDGYTLNRAYQSFRQPGSTIKPLIVYTPALQLGYDPEQMVEDKKFEGGPKNSGGTYSGKITLRKAIEQSKNVIAWKVFEDITPKVGLSFLKKMDFVKIVSDDYYPAAALGGLTYGASTLEMASGYAAIENDGIFREPTCIVKITDSKGELIVSDHINLIPIYEENASRMMTNVLMGVLKNGTGRGAALSNMSSAGKTGTTNNMKDGWFVGFTPYYTTSVWVGCDIPKTLSNLWGSTYPTSIWKQYMSDIHEGLKNIEFKDYIHKEIDTKEVTVEAPEEIIEEPVEEDITQDVITDNTKGTEDYIDDTVPVDIEEEEPDNLDTNVPNSDDLDNDRPTTEPIIEGEEPIDEDLEEDADNIGELPEEEGGSSEVEGENVLP